ncbi:MAG: hypothetical protein JSW07_09960 [bacterium]|nr:MAG: hypothetical protein JSW07_09960 [bacterium]
MVNDSFYRGVEQGLARDVAYTDTGIEFIKRRRNRPFFLWINNNYPHPLYRVREPFFSMYQRNNITCRQKWIIATNQKSWGASLKPINRIDSTMMIGVK